MSERPTVEIMGYNDPIVNAMRTLAQEYPHHDMSIGRQVTFEGQPAVELAVYRAGEYLGTVHATGCEAGPGYGGEPMGGVAMFEINPDGTVSRVG